jgi:hypothetical protein
MRIEFNMGGACACIHPVSRFMYGLGYAGIAIHGGWNMFTKS